MWFCLCELVLIIFFYSFRKMVFKWSNKHTVKFLNLYRNFNFLWDIANPLYKNGVSREAAYREIIAHMNVPNLTVHDVKKKIKTIRTNYKCELNKVLRSEKDGVHRSDVYVPHLFWFEKADEFLRDVSITKAAKHLNLDFAESDVSHTYTEDNTTQQSEFEICDIKVEDTMLQEDCVGDVQSQSLASVSIETSPSSSDTKILKIESVSSPASPADTTLTTIALDTMKTDNIPKRELTLSPDIEKFTNNELYSPASTPPTETVCTTRTLFAHATPSCRVTIRKRSPYLTALGRSINKLQRTIDLRRLADDDEFDLFGKSIALQLKRMPLERALSCQANLQRVMNLERLQQYKSQ